MLQAILVGLIACFVSFEWTLGSCLITRPIVTGVLVGLVMGDLQTGIIMGGTLELVFIGAVTLGAAVPPDVITGGILGTAFAISTGQGADVALTLAFPIATLYLLIDNAMTLFVMPFFLHRADRYVEQDDARGVKRMHFLGGFVVKSLPRGLFVGIAFYLGSPFMQMVLEKIPDFVQTGLSAAAGFIPALGIALLAQMIMSKKFVIFFILGFALSAYLQIPMLGVAIFGTVIALILVEQNSNQAVAAAAGGQEVPDDDDF